MHITGISPLRHLGHLVLPVAQLVTLMHVPKLQILECLNQVDITHFNITPKLAFTNATLLVTQVGVMRIAETLNRAAIWDVAIALRFDYFLHDEYSAQQRYLHEHNVRVTNLLHCEVYSDN
jgi:hypothetical protein